MAPQKPIPPPNVLITEGSWIERPKAEVESVTIKRDGYTITITRDTPPKSVTGFSG